MAKLETFLAAVGHYKILITIVIGVLVCGVFCDNSVVDLCKKSAEKATLEEELRRYRAAAERAQQQLDALESSPTAVERIAREQYFMKYYDEDVFVLSSKDDVIDNNDNEERKGE